MNFIFYESKIYHCIFNSNEKEARMPLKRVDCLCFFLHHEIVLLVCEDSSLVFV